MAAALADGILFDIATAEVEETEAYYAEGGCFAKGTEISTPEGEKPIESIKKGDTVFAYDFKQHHVITEKVTKLYRHTTRVWIDLQVGKDRLQATPNHPFWVVSREAWVEAGKLKAGAVLLLENGQTCTLTSVAREELSQPQDTYNLTVPNQHDYFVGSGLILVHNATCPYDAWEDDGGSLGPQAGKYGTTPEGRPLTRHYAQDTGEDREIPGSVVDQTINKSNGMLVDNGKTVYYDPDNNVTVVTGDGGSIVSARKGPPRKGQF